MKEIITSQLNKELRLDSFTDFILEYKDIYLSLPEYDDKYILTPQDCRLSNLTYSSKIKVDIKYTFNGIDEEIQKIDIGRLPIMVGCSKCYLNKLNKEFIEKSKFQIQECPLDPQGYFIIRGVEKVFLIQEQLADNRIIIEEDKQKQLVATVRSVTVDTKTVLTVEQKNGKFYVKCSSFKGSIPLFIFFKAYGIESEQEILQMISNDGHFINKLSLSLEDIEEFQINTQIDAQMYLGRKLKPKQFIVKNPKPPIEEVRNLLANVILCHIPCIQFNYYPRAFYLALMAKRLVEAIDNQSKVDQKDYYGNKRMKCAGWYLELLFEDKFKILNEFIKKQLNKDLAKLKNPGHSISQIIKAAYQQNQNFITNSLYNSISTGVWKIKRFHVDTIGVTQVLSRISYIGALGMMTRLNSQFSKTLKLTGPRSLLGSSWGLVCPTDTPDGESCGLTKNLALMAHITIPQTQSSMEDIGQYSAGEVHEATNFTVVLNGQVIGLVRTPEIFIRDLRLLRRRGKIDLYISISMNIDRRSVYLDTDEGRLCRPLIIVEKMKPKLQQTHLDQIQGKKIKFSDLIKIGVTEYIDVNEEDNALIALKTSDIKPDTTHLEIDPMLILGVVAGVVPYPHHNQASRNTFQCAMGKQALGIIGYNSMHRSDTLLYQLLYPQQPLVQTKSINLTCYNKLPAGHNASLAVLSYSGYDIEDAVVVNKASLDRGFGRTLLFRKYETELKKTKLGYYDKLAPPPQIAHDQKSQRNLKEFKRYQNIEPEDGIVQIGATLASGDVLVNKYSLSVPQNQKQYNKNDLHSDESLNDFYMPDPTVFKAKAHHTSRVDRVIVSNNDENNVIIKTMIREFRRPELGDKFSSRHGQKGVVGLIVNQEDMPFSETGWCPDLIMNPHGYPSRMTVGKLLELLGGKAGILDGKYKDGTAFAGDKLDVLSKILVDHGFSYTGKDVLISGITGDYMQCYVFCGPVFYQRLKHMVADKVHARSTGKISNLTRQPTEGRAKDGGLRLGEMERDCLLSYGSANLLVERLMISSDMYTVWVCDVCGFMKENNYCKICKTDKVFKIILPYACKLLFQELISMNIKPMLKLSNKVRCL